MRSGWIAAVIGLMGCGDRTVTGGDACTGGGHVFAGMVAGYEPATLGVPPEHESFVDPEAALGVPDYTGTGRGTGAVALGVGGHIDLAFPGCLLANDGRTEADLVIHEVGPVSDRVHVALSPMGQTRDALEPELELDGGFFLMGVVDGSRSEFDVDAAVPGFSRGELVFDAVRLLDDPTSGLHTPPAAGADIDAVELLHPVTSE